MIPRKADTADGIAMSLIFVFRWRIRKYAASAAPPWATLDIDQIGSSGLAPMAGSLSRPSSTAWNEWCRPVITSSE